MMFTVREGAPGDETLPRRPRRPTPQIVRDARRGVEDRQRALDEVCRGVLRDFVGRDMTPTLIAEAEAAMRLKVYFSDASTIIRKN